MKPIQIFLGIAISFPILALPAYLRCTQLSQSKFASPDLSFEDSGQEQGLPDSEKELKVYGASALLIISDLATNLFEQSFRFFSQRLFLHQKKLVLRC